MSGSGGSRIYRYRCVWFQQLASASASNEKRKLYVSNPSCIHCPVPHSRPKSSLPIMLSSILHSNLLIPEDSRGYIWEETTDGLASVRTGKGFGLWNCTLFIHYGTAKCMAEPHLWCSSFRVLEALWTLLQSNCTVLDLLSFCLLKVLQACVPSAKPTISPLNLWWYGSIEL